MSFKVPILFQFYNNYETTIPVFNEIKKVKPQYLYIVQDKFRPNYPEEEQECLTVRNTVLKMIDWDCKLVTLFRESNLGPGAGTADAILWFFSQVDYGIVFEHDCLPHPDFFEYCETLLEKYKNNKRVKVITGANFKGNKKFGNNSYYFGTLGHFWGWASWKRTFVDYIQDVNRLEEKEVLSWISRNFFKRRLKDYWIQTYYWLKEGTVDTWDYQLVYLIWKQKGLILLPNVNLISNIGFGEKALHCKGTGSPFSNVPTNGILPLVHPLIVKRSFKSDVYYCDYLYNLNIKVGLLYKIKRRMKNFIRKFGYKIIRFIVPEIALLKGNEDWFNEIKTKNETAILNKIKDEFGHCGKNVNLHYPITVINPQNVYLFENTNIYENSTVLTVTAKFIMKANSGAAQGLTVITGNHTGRVGVWFKDLIHKEDEEKDIIVEEDVWIGTSVTLLAGVKIGRGSIIGAGSVCRKSIPPYAIVVGNPAKIVGFRFNPVEVIEHEKKLYPANERLTFEILEKNYNKYSLSSSNGIQDYLKLSCSE